LSSPTIVGTAKCTKALPRSGSKRSTAWIQADGRHLHEVVAVDAAVAEAAGQAFGQWQEGADGLLAHVLVLGFMLAQLGEAAQQQVACRRVEGVGQG
jgi:hypothetical protein